MWFPIGIEMRCTNEQRGYLETRCTKKDQGFYLVYAPCKHLVKIDDVTYLCGIHDVKPKACKMYKGQKRYKEYVFYKPPTCTMGD
jgi:Fe-S-cluster containining protein